jgi:hypothetical protein
MISHCLCRAEQSRAGSTPAERRRCTSRVGQPWRGMARRDKPRQISRYSSPICLIGTDYSPCIICTLDTAEVEWMLHLACAAARSSQVILHASERSLRRANQCNQNVSYTMYIVADDPSAVCPSPSCLNKHAIAHRTPLYQYSSFQGPQDFPSGAVQTPRRLPGI